MCLLGLLYIGLLCGVGRGLEPGVLGADACSFLPNLHCFNSVTLALGCVWCPQVETLLSPDSKYFVSCCVWREVVSGESKCSLYRFFNQFFCVLLNLSFLPPTLSFQEAIQILLVENPFFRHLLFSFISCARSVTISPLSGFQNFIHIFCPLSSSFPFFVLVSLYPLPMLYCHFNRLWVTFNQRICHVLLSTLLLHVQFPLLATVTPSQHYRISYRSRCMTLLRTLI